MNIYGTKISYERSWMYTIANIYFLCINIKICEPTNNLGVLNSFRRVRVFKIDLEFGNDGF